MSHARLPPSSAHRWVKCPGSVREEAKYPDVSGEAAIDGTHTHTLLERCLIYDYSADEFVGVEMSDHEGDFLVDQERADRVGVALGYIRGRAVEIGKPVTVRAESKVNPGIWLDRDDCMGTADCIIVGQNAIEIIDYKDGMVPVSAENNWQMILYTLGVLAEYKDAVFDDIRMTIIQPKLSLSGLNPISTHRLTSADVDAFAKDLKAAAYMTDSPDAPLVAGESQCKWCKAKGNCEVLSDKALATAQVMFKDVELAEQSAEIAPNEMSDDKIRQIMEALPLLREYIKTVEEEAYKRLNTGTAIPGLKLVHGRGSRKYNCDDEAMAEKLKKMGVPKGVIYPTKLISVAQLEMARWTKKKKTGEEVPCRLSARQLDNIRDNYVETTLGKLQVALESDSKPAVIRSAKALFKDVKPVETVETVNDIPAWMQ